MIGNLRRNRDCFRFATPVSLCEVMSDSRHEERKTELPRFLVMIKLRKRLTMGSRARSVSMTRRRREAELLDEPFLRCVGHRKDGDARVEAERESNEGFFWDLLTVEKVGYTGVVEENELGDEEGRARSGEGWVLGREDRRLGSAVWKADLDEVRRNFE